MAYNLTKSDEITPLVTLLDGEIDTTATDLVLLGKNYLGYGQIIAENFARHIENFAGKSRGGLNSLNGQLYFNRDPGATLQIPAPGTLPATLQLHVGPDYRNLPADWLNITAFSDGNGVFEINIKDRDGITFHKCIKIIIKNVLVAILSVDADFTPHPDEQLQAFCGGLPGTPDATEGDYNNTGTIGRGLNLNSSQDFKIRGVAVEAEFADVAEIYVGDATYEAGTLVSLGGAAEVTQTTGVADTNVFGIVSTRPAYLMNTKAKGRKNALPVAVAGRIPVKVKGKINRGDRLTASDIPGVAQAATGNEPTWSIVGRSLANFDGDGIGKVEATVGVR
jgi:hypothetical protein